MNAENTIKKMPAVALRGMTILPEMIIHFDLSRERSIVAVNRALQNGEEVLLITQKDAEEERLA